MHAFLVTGGTRGQRLDRIKGEIDHRKVRSFDERRLTRDPESPSLGIKDVKEWQKKLILFPSSSPYTCGVIEEAELLTIEAQQALLKTIEEPPPHAIIYLEAPSTTPFLPTILSRCQALTIPGQIQEEEDIQTQFVKTLQTLSDSVIPIGKKMAVLDAEIADKGAAKQWVKTALGILHTHRLHFPRHAYVMLSQSLLRAHQDLSANVSYKLALDRIFLP